MHQSDAVTRHIKDMAGADRHHWTGWREDQRATAAVAAGLDYPSPPRRTQAEIAEADRRGYDIMQMDETPCSQH